QTPHTPHLFPYTTLFRSVPRRVRNDPHPPEPRRAVHPVAVLRGRRSRVRAHDQPPTRRRPGEHHVSETGHSRLPHEDLRLPRPRSEEHTSELQSPDHLVC